MAKCLLAYIAKAKAGLKVVKPPAQGCACVVEDGDYAFKQCC